jgi:hypothetical protein
MAKGRRHVHHKKVRGRGFLDSLKKGASTALALSNQFGIADKLANSSNPKVALAGKLLGMADGSKTGKPRRRHMKRGGGNYARNADGARMVITPAQQAANAAGIAALVRK